MIVQGFPSALSPPAVALGFFSPSSGAPAAMDFLSLHSGLSWSPFLTLVRLAGVGGGGRRQGVALGHFQKREILHFAGLTSPSVTPL